MTEAALASILIPILGALLVLVIPKTWAKWFSQGVACLAVLSSLILLVALFAHGKSGLTVDLLRLGNILVFSVVIDKLSVLIGLAFILVGFLILIYSGGYLSAQNREHPANEVGKKYYFFLLLFIGAMAGVVFSGTMIALLVFFELTGMCSWGLIGYYDDLKSRKAALKAILTTQVASLGLYIATALLFVLTGGFQLTALSQLNGTFKLYIFIGVFIGAWGKSAQLPFHFWLPDAMAAPTPISAYLHAASMVKAGVYIIARMLLSANGVPKEVGVIGSVMAIITILYGFIMYLPQKDIKRLLAYSTITQLAYVFFALSLSILGSGIAFNGAVAHIFNHAFAKSLFFLVAGALGYSTGTRLIGSFKGIMTKMPLLGVCFAVAALAVTGMPPFNCFFSKFSIFVGGFEAAKTNPWLLVLVVIAVLESVLSFAWIFWVFSSTVPGEPSQEVAGAVSLAPSMKAVLGALAVLTLVSGYFAAVWLG